MYVELNKGVDGEDKRIRRITQRRSPGPGGIRRKGIDGPALRVSVVGCNGSGKDWAAARAVLWWSHSRSPAEAIVTGPTNRQVDDIVWNEIRAAYGKAPDRLGGRMFRTARYEKDEQSFALGFVTDSPYNLQGFHSPNLLVVITEAHAVREADINAIRRLNPTRLLMTGNPFVNAGTFYDSHHSRRELHQTVQISAFDTPNIQEQKVVIPGMITQQDIDDRKEDWDEDSAMYVGSVLGEFSDNLDGVVVPFGAGHGGRQASAGLSRTRLVPFIAGQRANDNTHFVNRGVEVWWAMRNSYLSEELDTDDDAALIGQVSSREYSWDGDGRIKLQSKETMYRSPDEADALAMTFAAQRGGVKIWV